jgi:multidrug efflux pump subunit AcrB
MSRSRAKELGDFIDPGQAGLIVVGESKVEEAIQKAVTRAEKETAEELGVDPQDIDKVLQQAVGEM